MTARLVLALLAFTCFGRDQTPGRLYGKWKVTSVASSSPVTAMSGDAAQRLVGQFLFLKPHSVQFAAQTCRPTYEISKETFTEFVQDYRVDPKTLNLSEPVARFDAACTDVFVTGPTKIIFTWKGYFLEAAKSTSNK